MRDAVVIGGGLTGLVTAYELEKRKIPYTLIEVKDRLGGSIITVHDKGFVVDGGPFLLPNTPDWHNPAVVGLLTELGLHTRLYHATGNTDRDAAVFKDGTGALTNALASHLNGTIMKRMAVASLGRLENRFTICLENGIAMSAGAIIVTAPARYAERMFRTLQQEIAYRLLRIQYENVLRVSLGYRKAHVGIIPHMDDVPVDYPLNFLDWTDNPHRVPRGHVLLQAGIRFEHDHGMPKDPVGELAALMEWPFRTVVERYDYFPEADTLIIDVDEHLANVEAIRHLLPDGVALGGSDYFGWTIPERILQGQQAAHRIATWLQAR